VETGARGAELRAVVVEASQSLARLDASRLQELALSCEALNRQMEQLGQEGQEDAGWRNGLARQAREARQDMEIFGRVLEATRANLNVMQRLRAMRMGELEYRAQLSEAIWSEKSAENGDGND
jgi:hypothetical protein